MVEKLKSFLINMSKGVITPIIVIFIFSLTIGLFLSLTLLVVSIEEGAGNLSESAMSMTWAVFMFAQGVGITFGNCILTIIPLGLTFLLIATLVCLIRRIRGGDIAYFTGLVVWAVINAILSQNTHVTLLDSTFIVACKSSCIYLISLLIAVFPSSSLFMSLKQRYKQMCPEYIQKNIRITKRTAVILFGLYAFIALITVVVWACTNFGYVNSYFNKLVMQNGSRILTTIACLVWLPNIAIWALSWICGSGFNIGSVAHFTLAVSQRKSLPPIPVFGIFPDAIVDVMHRTVFYSIVPIFCFIVMLITLLHKSGCGLRLKNIIDKTERESFMLNAVEAATDSVGVSALITIMWTVVFSIANGSLGECRLSYIGVDIIESTRAVGHLTLYASAVAWVISIFSILLICGARYCFNLIAASKSNKPVKSAELIENKTSNKKNQPLPLKKAAPRTVSSKAKRK